MLMFTPKVSDERLQSDLQLSPCSHYHILIPVSLFNLASSPLSLFQDQCLSGRPVPALHPPPPVPGLSGVGVSQTKRGREVPGMGFNGIRFDMWMWGSRFQECSKMLSESASDDKLNVFLVLRISCCCRLVQ